MITRDMINAEVNFYKTFRKQLADSLRNLPAGRLYYKTSNGHKRPFVMEDGKEKYLSRKYLKRIIGLQKRRDIECCLSGVDSNLELLKSVSSRLCDIEDIIPEFISLPDIINPNNRKSRAEISALMDRWAESKTRSGKPRYKGNHMTSDGTAVKSRAELILYEYFSSQNLNHIYEKPLLVDGETWYPDFSFLRESDGDVIIWEHFGMMNDPDYRNGALYKMDRYAGAGFLPFRNLVITYDFGGDNIDLPHVHQLLRLMALVE